MIALDITPEEVESRRMAPEHLAAALRALQEDGFVVLNGVVDTGHLAVLREKMLADVPFILRRKDAPLNFVNGHIQHDPPPFPPYLFRDVLLNDMVVAVTRAMLGPGVKNGFYSGNTNLPGSQTQPVHVDTGQLWPNLEVAHPAHALVVNLCVMDMDESNGSIELWPGTHWDTTLSVFDTTLRIPEAKLEQRRKVAPPLQPHVPCGGVLIRDIRLWHRGMPNRSDVPRPMIAMIHQCRWWQDVGRILFPKGTEPFFEGSELTTLAEFVDGPIDYLNRHEAYDYQPWGSR